MTKALSLLLLVAMAAHLVKPLGLPGLRKRGDFWKIALFALGLWALAFVLREAAELV